MEARVANIDLGAQFEVQNRFSSIPLGKIACVRQCRITRSVHTVHNRPPAPYDRVVTRLRVVDKEKRTRALSQRSQP